MNSTSTKSPFTGRIKIFVDGAEPKTILEALKVPYVKGFTTNPSLVRAAGVSDYKAYALELLKHVKEYPISFEVFADDFNEMRQQALEIKTWAPNVYVKIPVVNTEGKSAAPLIRELSQNGVCLNVTAVFTLSQVWEVCQALKGGAPSFLSVFAGRYADTGRDPIPLMQSALAMCQETDSKIELLWASTREFWNIIQADVMGCPIITAPFDMVKKLSTLGKDPYQASLDTVRLFKKDSDAAGFKL